MGAWCLQVGHNYFSSWRKCLLSSCFYDKKRHFGSCLCSRVSLTELWRINTEIKAIILYYIVFTGSADSEMSEEQKKEKLSELRKKEQEIQDILAKKTKELKKICLREAVRNHLVLHFSCTGTVFCKAYTSRFSSQQPRPDSRREAVLPCNG